MEFARSLRRLWRHQLFRRLLAVRVATQSCDGLLQIALASYVLFSPERQPDAVSIATVLAVTLLPFSVLGPFVGIVLDRWSRRQIMVAVDLSRSVIALGLAALVATGIRGGVIEIVFYGLVLLAQSLNRFLLAALSAALPHTIDDDEYLVANSVVPTVGPAGVLIGAGLGTVLRLVLGPQLPASAADAILFAVAAGGYVLSASLALRIPRDSLGPDDVEPAKAGDVLAGLVGAVRHLQERRPAGLGLLTIGAHRIVYGLVTVATILVYRNYFHTVAEVEPAIADLGLLVVVTGAGFVLAAALTPPLIARLGARAWMVTCLIGSAVFQLLPGAIYTKATLLIAALLLGITAQAIKITVDTFVQAYVDDDLKGRVFVLYDMVFNVALVLAAGLGALILPVDGVSVPILVVLAAVYLLTGVGFAVLTRRLDLSKAGGSLRTPVPAADPLR
ncbi:MAG: MFS transporter [Propionibacteriaceae bacterium]